MGSHHCYVVLSFILWAFLVYSFSFHCCTVCPFIISYVFPSLTYLCLSECMLSCIVLFLALQSFPTVSYLLLLKWQLGGVFFVSEADENSKRLHVRLQRTVQDTHQTADYTFHYSNMHCTVVSGHIAKTVCTFCYWGYINLAVSP